LLIWTKSDPQRLSNSARDHIIDTTNVLYFSSASIWEISIKRQRGRPDFKIDPHLLHETLLDDGYTELPVVSFHAFGIVTLPMIHKDPFDRILIAQAAHEGCLFLTSDSRLATYPGPIRLV